MDPMVLFPPEIWELIFDKVEEPQDWFNLYQASPSFEGVVGKQRATTLFPLVFPNLRPYLMYTKLSAAVLHLRLVSSTWKCSVDTNLEGLELNAKNFRCNLKYDFWASTPLTTFLDKFGDHPGNPIIGRSVKFSYSRDRHNPRKNLESRARIRRAMNTFGVHIRKLAIEDFAVGDTQHDNCFLRLRNVVQAAPALESLSFFCSHLDEAEHNNNELVAFVKNTPLPARPVISGLKSLYLVGFGDSSEFLVKLQNLVITTCCNPDSLRKVDVVGVPEALQTFGAVENAVLYLQPGDELKLDTVFWPLTSLTLYPDERRGIRHLFGIAELFKGTLTSLTIANNLGRVPGESIMDFRVELPHLQYLQIPQIICFEIFGNLGSLQVLTVFNSKWLNRETKAKFVEAVEREVVESWSWELLPKLRQVVVKGTVINTEAGRNDDPVSFQHALARDLSKSIVKLWLGPNSFIQKNMLLY